MRLRFAMKDLNTYIDHLIDIMDGIELNKITVLTGNNGSGKSMIRKLLHQFLHTKPSLKDKNINNIIASISMDDRSGINPNQMMVFSRDCEWLPTSENTLNSIQSILKTKDRFLILDELELGMGEELQAGLAEYLNQNLHIDQTLGVLIITHSRTMVKHLKHDNFINLENMSEEQWMNREIIPMSPAELLKNSSELYQAFQKRLKP